MTATSPKKDPKQAFPEDLLRESDKTGHKYFEDLRLSHQCIKDAQAQVIHAIEYPCNDSFIFVVGPPRAGKTTTFEGLRDDLTMCEFRTTKNYGDDDDKILEEF